MFVEVQPQYEKNDIRVTFIQLFATFALFYVTYALFTAIFQIIYCS